MNFSDIENDRRLTRAADVEFFRELERALLLEMKEHGYLNEIEYRHADERLREKHLIRMKQKERRDDD